MNTDWLNFLKQHHANINNDQVVGFSNATDEIEATTKHTIIADLSHFGLIRASGEEAADFLQNQFTNDLKDVSPSQSQLTAYCSPKGRMLASFRVFQFNDDYYLELSADILEATLKRLRMFVLRSKVTLNDVSNEWCRMGVAGDKASQLLASQFSTVPAENGQSVIEHDCVLIRLPGTHPGFEIHGTVNALTSIWTSLEQNSKPVGKIAWDSLGTRAGIPVIQARTSEAFVPQMANFTAIGGVSFTKGCYPGQEVVARMRYLGKLKRRMYLAHIDTDTVPEPGDELFPSGNEETQSCGKIVQAQPAPGGGVNLLAVIQISAAEQEPSIHVGSPDGLALKLLDDPYPVTNKA